ncbi:AraC-like ligand-binding domain-containing protein [Hydrogenophaga sp. A37]|uniref:AraC-like ligand-binding domain-containing protein n=1 Tax=Hydrogenophaga sp. A37 TaxID=1945864 RepID=UPI0009876443|nr:helix-turn-helix domain-containing protein [Hydrogenophaga sp. A37]OOG83831.1 DNA-binding protein [Hydrogenophaga sp. A37]
MIPLPVMSTDAVAPGERAAAWRDWVWRHFGGLESDLYGDTVFDGHMSASQAGDVVLTKLEANRHRVLRSPKLASASDTNYLKIVAPWQGSAAVEQQGRQAWVRPGGWAIYDTTGSYEITNPERVEHLIVMLPKQQFIERGLRLEPLMARHVGGASGISRVALETMRSTYQELPAMSETTARGAGEMIIELVRLSLQELAGRESATTQLEAFRDRIREHIGHHLRDPDLSIERIAQSMNCSKRHLHNAFSTEDDTLAHHILRRRLQACMRDLKNPALAQRTITDIAFSWGFSNGAHFSRVFREHAGLPPSDFRDTALRQSATV